MNGTEQWTQAVRDVGFPIVAYGAFAFALWKTIQWVGHNVVLPIQARAFHFLDVLEVVIKRVESRIERIDGTAERHAEMLAKIAEGQKDSEEARRDLIAVQRNILEQLKDNGVMLKGFVCKATEMAGKDSNGEHSKKGMP